MLITYNNIKPLEVSKNKYPQVKIHDKIYAKILNVIQWLLVQNQILGLVTFSFTKRGFFTSKIRCAINVLTILIYIPISVYGIYSMTTDDSSVIIKTTNIIQLTLNSSYTITIWICSMINSKNFMQLLIKLIDFDVKLLNTGATIDYEKNRKRLLVQLWGRYIMLAISVAYLTVFNTYDGIHVFIFQGMYYFTLVINSAMCHQTIELILMIKTRFAILNNEIKNLVEYFIKNNINIIDKNMINKKENYEQLSTLNNICALHHQLSKLVKLVNETFGIILLLMFGVSFITIVVSLFYCTGGLQANEIDWLQTFTPLLASWTFIFDTVYICNTCYSAIEEANKSGELIHKIETNDHDIRDEIEMFSLQIANEHVEFNAAGFFPINYTLLFSIIGGVTTYIIILIQLSATLVKK